MVVAVFAEPIPQFVAVHGTNADAKSADFTDIVSLAVEIKSPALYVVPFALIPKTLLLSVINFTPVPALNVSVELYDDGELI